MSTKQKPDRPTKKRIGMKFTASPKTRGKTILKDFLKSADWRGAVFPRTGSDVGLHAGARRRPYAFADILSWKTYCALRSAVKQSPDKVRLVVIIGPHGTGKTLIARELMALAGHPNPPVSMIHSSAELVKQLPFLLRDGAVHCQTAGRISRASKDLMEAFVSAPIWTYRVLGTLQIKHVSLAGWLFVETWDESFLTPDLVRRADVIRLKGEA